MVVGWTLFALKRGSCSCRIEHCNPFRKPTENFEERQKYRRQIWSAWLNSVADDLDMITDWWFFIRMYSLYGISLDGGMEARATLALLVFTLMGSLSYLLELYQLLFKYPATFEWLPLFTILFEDVPQILLSIILSGSLQKLVEEPTALAAFNISTSLYSAMIKVSGELFLNYFYCCKFTPPEERYVEMEAGRGSST